MLRRSATTPIIIEWRLFILMINIWGREVEDLYELKKKLSEFYNGSITKWRFDNTQWSDYDN